LTTQKSSFDTLQMNGWRGGRLTAATVAALVLTLSACDGSSGGGAGDPGGGSGGSGGGKAAQPVSPEIYRTTLLGVSTPINKALTALAGAGSFKALTGRIADLDIAARLAIAKLRQQTPPAAVAAEHARLVAALQQFDDAVKALSEDVDGKSLCTASSTRAQLGRAGGTTALRAAAAALTAKAPDDMLVLKLPAAARTAAHRLSNGHFVRSGGRGGRGTLTIDNGGDSDAVITLAKGKRPVISVYVRKDKKYTVNGISDGTYKVFFSGGVDWDGKARRFARDCAFQQFDDKFSFRTTRTATEIRWSTWEVSLQPVVGGTASTSDVDPNDYPGS
jgi:hypothetical protein